jgi:type II secretory pathway pseudopilin PulG
MSEPAPQSNLPLWQRHRGLLIALVIFVVLLVTVISDLPVSTSRADDISAERSVLSEVNTDLAGCALAINQAIGIWNLQAAHQLSAADRAPTPGLLSDDQTACSFTNEDIFDLTNIQVPGTPAGKNLGQMLATATLWTTSDALRAIEDVQTLMNDPGDVAALRNLSHEEQQLATDRRVALEQERAADRDLDTHLPTVDLPTVHDAPA